MADETRTKSPRRRCVYCAAPAGSLEHAFPRWLQEWMNPVKQRRIWQLPNGKIVDGHSWNMSTHRHICERCNQWMGATYEAPVSALIRRLVDLEHELTLAR